MQWANEVYSSAQLSGVLAATSVCFDLSIFEIFVPLSRGGSVILAENVLQLPTLPAAEKVTLINTVPTAITELARINGIPSSVSTINLAGEPIPSSLVQQLYDIASIQQVFNLYGPSEDTTYSTYTLLSPEDVIVPIGKPIANTQAYVLDEQQNSVPIGMTGELHLGGQGVAREYWNQPALTSSRFVAGLRLRSALDISKPRRLSEAVHEASPQVLARLQPAAFYKTGDLVRHRPDGQLEFLGRIDSQVKIRGFRIELGEIESVLLKHSQVIQTAVIDWSDAQNNRQLVAYVVLDEPADKALFEQALQTTSELLRELRSHLKTSLPDYMLPAIFVPLGRLPLLPNGKISRRALPAPIFKEASKVKESVLTTTEQALVNVWQGLLNQPVGIHDNFFELGGDSILAIQAIAQAQKVGLYFSPRDLFQYATIFQLAGIATTQPHSQAQQSSIVGAVPLTPIQHWFFQQTLEAPHHWNQSVLLTVKQPLRSDILEQALRQLMHHHDALRATFQKTDKGWHQCYSKPSEIVPLKVVQERVENATHVITAEAEAIQSSFELESGPLLKVVYYDLKTSA
ncbi:MAG: AMP-binding protein, partial [Cyanobacteria bacterium J06560_2]